MKMTFSRNVLKVSLTGLIMFYSCSNEAPDPTGARSPTPAPKSNGGTWDIPEAEVFDGGPGKDGIPALLNPEMIGVDEVDFISDFELVLGYKNGDDVRAYPHKILDQHEIINDEVNGDPVAITYCPLTGTGIGWGRMINGTETTFGVSGLLYNTNLIPYDRNTDSNWSQINLDCVNGPLRGKKVTTFQLVETTWEVWRRMYPQTKVVSLNTGFSRNYQFYPYGNYRTAEGTIFPYTPRDTRLHEKERVHGIIVKNKVKAYRFGLFSDEPRVIEDNFQLTPIVVVGDEKSNIILSFERELQDGTLLSFELTPEAKVSLTTSTILVDNEGTSWNVFGEGVSGPRIGKKLMSTTSFMGYWFSWGAFYSAVEIADF